MRKIGTIITLTGLPALGGLLVVFAPFSPILAQETSSSTNKGFMPNLIEMAPKGLFDGLFNNQSAENGLDKAKNAVLDEVEQGVDMAGKALQNQIEQQARQGLDKLKGDTRGIREKTMSAIKNIGEEIKNIFTKTYRKIFKKRATF